MTSKPTTEQSKICDCSNLETDIKNLKSELYEYKLEVNSDINSVARIAEKSYNGFDELKLKDALILKEITQINEIWDSINFDLRKYISFDNARDAGIYEYLLMRDTILFDTLLANDIALDMRYSAVVNHMNTLDTVYTERFDSLNYKIYMLKQIGWLPYDTIVFINKTLDEYLKDINIFDNYIINGNEVTDSLLLNFINETNGQ